MTLAGNPVNHSGKVTPRLCNKEAANIRRFREGPTHFDLMIQVTTALEYTVCASLSHLGPVTTFLPSDPSCPLAVATPIVQESTALRIVLASPFARCKAFACFLLAFLQDLLNDINVYMCAKLGVEFLL
jgi:hypothetical protein